MVNPARDTTAGRVYNNVRNSARRQRRATDEVMVEYVLERFLYRLPHLQLAANTSFSRAVCSWPSSAHAA